VRTPFTDFLFDLQGSCIRHAGDTVDGERLLVLDGWREFLLTIAKELVSHNIKAVAEDRLTIYTGGETTAEFLPELTAFFGSGDVVTDILSNSEIEDPNGWILTEEDLAKMAGFDDVGYSDEWDECIDCGKLIHTQPEHYCDHGRYVLFEDGYECADCMLKNKERTRDEIIGLAERDKGVPVLPFCPNQLDTYSPVVDVGAVDLTEDHRVFQVGLHEGMADDVRAIYKVAYMVDEECVFGVSPSQFYSEYELWCSSEVAAEAVSFLLAGGSYYTIHECENNKYSAAVVGSLRDDCSRAVYLIIDSRRERHITFDGFVAPADTCAEALQTLLGDAIEIEHVDLPNMRLCPSPAQQMRTSLKSLRL
jgi:hypothetical protein